MRYPLLLTIILCGYAMLQADSVAPSRQYLVTSPSSRYYFVMLPSRSTEAGQQSNEDGGSGVAYRLMRDGSIQEMWRTKGWYSQKVFLAEDCRYLVRIDSVIEGNAVSDKDVAVAFYDKGVLIKSYSTKDLVLDSTKISVSVSYYKWLARDVARDRYVIHGGVSFDSEPEPVLTIENTFRLKTADGILYTFDVSNGNIVSKEITAVTGSDR